VYNYCVIINVSVQELLARFNPNIYVFVKWKQNKKSYNEID